MSVRLVPAVVILATFWVHATAIAQDPQTPGPGKSGIVKVSEQARIDDIARATLFEPLDITRLDTRTGRQFQQKRKNLPNDVTIECYYQQDTFRGKTDKFKCAGAKDPNDSSARLPVIVTDAAGQPVDVKLDKIKVRYGSEKVFSSVITTRLAWALGFGSDVETPVAKVICHGCSKDPFRQKGPVDETTEFPKPGDRPQVSVEQKLDGTGIVVAGLRFYNDNGEDSPVWNWSELHYITDSARNAQAEALKLFAAFIQHVDSKALQNELFCRSKVDSGGICQDPILYVHDFGNTLGTTGTTLGVIGAVFGVYGIHPLDLRAWKNAKVWKDEKACVAALQMVSGTGPGLTNPTISEPGRRLLADRLSMLISAQNGDGSSKLRDIFDAAHIEKYDDHGSHFTADDWVQAFTTRARQIIEKTNPCP